MTLTSIRLRTSSHLLTDALCTASQSQSGISLSALAHAWASLMKDTPNRVSTERATVSSGNEKDRSAPAWMGEGDEVPAKVRKLVFVEIVMFVGLEVETDLYVPDSTSVCDALFGGRKS